jgi:hypothetical protein
MNRTQRCEAILTAGREGVRRRLIDEKRLPKRVADEWLLAWTGEAQRQGLTLDVDYWRNGSRWILAELDNGMRAPSG